MKQEFVNYLKDIGLSKTMQNVVGIRYELMRTAANIKEFDDILISEATSNVGNKEYFDLLCFNPKILCRISIHKNELVMLKIENHITNITFENWNFDLVTPSNDSKLFCAVRRTSASAPIEIHSSGINCAHLLEISKKYFLKHLGC